ncbi:MAG: thiamine phosphate synthase [Bryobacterales bacterium]|nr:thiamine phosphate synthase [Bryobacterales bacterium]MBV9397517.1 thiamine phosphate synthase [Bryobacterales bacterium]
MLLPRFYPILDTETAARHGIRPESAALEMVAAGVRILQLRHKGFWSRETVDLLQRIGAICRDAGALFVVNDRADLARLMGAALHLGQDDLRPSEVRSIVGATTPIGLSTHNEAQLRAAADEPADYLALGPIFGTASKQNPDPIVRVDGLRRLRPLSNRPLVAIGGITRANAIEVFDAGADSAAVIGDLFPNVRARCQEWIALTNAAPLPQAQSRMRP